MKNIQTSHVCSPHALVAKWRDIVFLLMATLILCGFNSIAFANGEISFVAGKAQIIGTGGDARKAGKGDKIEPGTILVTGADGEIHALMADNAVIAVRPNSRMKIEEYVANGDDKDRAVLSLLKGQLRSITGWIGKIAPKNYAVRTPSGTIGIRGTDHEVAVIDGDKPGEEAGTYDKVNFGETLLRTAFGFIPIKPGFAGFARKGATSAPVVLAVVPQFYKPTPNETLINQTKARAEEAIDKKLKEKQDEVHSQGGLTESGNPKISDLCTQDPASSNAFKEFVRAFEQGNVALIRSRLDPSMLGFSRFIDGIIQDSNRFKQMQLLLKDTQIQCGPDLTVIQTLWEKRFLDVNTFAPGLHTGRATILMHRDQGTWKIAALNGDNPFSSQSGVLGQVVFGPTLSLAGVTATPTNQPLNIEVLDPDLAGTRNLTVQIVTSQGDSEMMSLQETTPGRFTRSTVTMSSNAPVPGNNVLEVSTGVVSTLRYVDQNPGNNRPATQLTRSVAAIGTATGGNGGNTGGNTGTVGAFAFATQSPVTPSTHVTSNTVTISGITAPVAVSVIGGSYSINGGSFTSAPGTIAAGQTLALQVLSSPISNGISTATVTVGTAPPASFIVTTGNMNPFPPPAYAALLTQPTNGYAESSPATVSGINLPAPISIVGGDYSINGGPYVNTPGTVTNGQPVRIRISLPNADNVTVTATMTIGTVQSTFSATTWNTVPTSILIPQWLSSTFSSPCTAFANVTITGLTGPTLIRISGPTGANAAYSINGGAYVTTQGTLPVNASVSVKASDSPYANGYIPRADLVIGGRQAQFLMKCQ